MSLSSTNTEQNGLILCCDLLVIQVSVIVDKRTIQLILVYLNMYCIINIR